MEEEVCISDSWVQGSSSPLSWPGSPSRVYAVVGYELKEAETVGTKMGDEYSQYRMESAVWNILSRRLYSLFCCMTKVALKHKTHVVIEI